MDASALQERVDLSQFSTAECSRIWEVLQRDFQVRYEESRMLDRLHSRVAQANEKAQLLGDVENFNGKYCVICFESFIFIINPSFECYVCTCFVCKKCSRFVTKFDARICRLCEEEKNLIARQCSWFYSNSRKTFVVDTNPTAIPQDRFDGPGSIRSGDHADGRRTSSGVVPDGTGLSAPRDETEEALKRITGLQIMRFQQKMNSVSTEVRSFLRDHILYEIPEAGVDRHYDLKINSFNNEVIDILRNFSQTLYIAIEGFHSRTGKPLRNVHQEVHLILQDEVENLVGFRVDVREDDDLASVVSDEDGASTAFGPGNIQEKLSRILIDKWLADHQRYLDDQKLSASDLYTQNALENFLTKKSRDGADYGGISFDGDWPHEEEEDLVATQAVSAFNAAPTGFRDEVDPDLLSLRDSRQLDRQQSSLGGSSSGNGGNWLLKGRPNVSNSFGESMHHFEDTPSPRIGAREASELSDELSANETSADSNDEDEVNTFLTRMEREEERKKSTVSIDFDDVYNQNLTLYSDSTPERQREHAAGRSEPSQDSGVHLNGHATSPVARLESVDSESSARARKVSLGFLKMDWSFSEHSDPCFISKTTEVASKVAECASICVEVDGTLPIDVYWYRVSSDDLVQLEENDRIEFVAANDFPGKHTLHVWHVQEEDAGEYLAVAVNEKGSNKQGFKITVLPNDEPLRMPEFAKLLTSDDVRRTDTARLRCRVAGYPHPRVLFMKDGAPLPNNDKFQTMRIGERAYTLSVHDVQPEDEGSYVCVATNAAGSCQSIGSVSITTALNPSPRVDGEPLVDTSPAVKVRSQVQLLGQDDPHCSSLFIDRVEPLRKPDIGDLDLSKLPPARSSRSLPVRRQESSGVARRPEVREESVAAVRTAAAFSAPTVRVNGAADPLQEENFPAVEIKEDDLVIDCGLKRVNSLHKRDFRIKPTPPRSPTAKRVELRPREKPQPAVEPPRSEMVVMETAAPPLQQEVAETPVVEVAVERESTAQQQELPESQEEEVGVDTELLEDSQEPEPSLEVGVGSKGIPKRREKTWSPIVADASWKTPVDRRNSTEMEEPVSTLKERFEKGISRPVPSNPYASFRTRKFPSVAAIKTQFSKPVRGSYLKRMPPVAEESSLPSTQKPARVERRRQTSTLPSRKMEDSPSKTASLDRARDTVDQSEIDLRYQSLPNRVKDEVVVPEFFHVKLKPTGRPIDD